MTPMVRLGQCALTRLLLHAEPTGAVESSKRIYHRAAWKIPMQLLPAIPMRDAGC